MRESCYSSSGDDDITVKEGIDGLNGDLRKYKYASLCNNVRSVNHGKYASIIREDGIKVLSGAGSRNRDLEIFHSSHHSTVADVITQNTTASVKQWHTHIKRLLGTQDSNRRLQYTFTESMRSIGSLNSLRDALRALTQGFQGLNGVEVINISGGGNAESMPVYPTPCDNHSEVTGSPLNIQITEYINTLYNRGVMVVAASNNHTGSRLIDNYKMPFPACLSRTIGVAGYRENTGEVRGAVSPHTDFVHDMHHTNPSEKFLTLFLKVGLIYSISRR